MAFFPSDANSLLSETRALFSVCCFNMHERVKGFTEHAWYESNIVKPNLLACFMHLTPDGTIEFAWAAAVIKSNEVNRIALMSTPFTTVQKLNSSMYCFLAFI